MSRPRPNPNQSQSQSVQRRLVTARQIGPGAVHALREDLATDSRLGYGHLGIGAIILAAALFARGAGVALAEGIVQAPGTFALPTLLAWLLAALAFIGSCVAARLFGGRLPPAVFASCMVLLATALTLDVASNLSATQPILHTSTVFGVGAALLAIVGYRPARQLLLANGVFALVLLALLGIGMARGGGSDGASLQIIAGALLPPLLGTLTVRGFGELVQLELDRSIAESTLLAPRFAFGMRASDELASLDLAAEEILDNVAAARISLPLDTRSAESAATIASDLRRLLVARRHDTWLHHAVAESEILGPQVSVNDALGLAGYLDASEREGLLSAIWLIVASSSRVQPTILVDIDQVGTAGNDVEVARNAPDMMVISIAMTVDSVPPRRIDPAVWPALDRVGDHSEMATGGSTKIVTTVRTASEQAAP